MQYAVIVDGYSSGGSLAKLFKAQGWLCIHIQTVWDAHPYYYQAFDKNDYELLIDYEGDFQKLIKQLSSYPITCALAGFDMGVELADQLSDYFKLLGNSADNSAARFNKLKQRQLLSKNNLFPWPFFASDSINDIETWLQQQKQWPLVVKPLKSASSEDVQLCRDKPTALKACQRIIDKKNVFGNINQKALIEAFIEGHEYRVNSVSYAGKHKFTDLWDVNKVRTDEGYFLSDKAILLPATGAVAQQLRHYMEQVLTVLGVDYGAATADVMLTNNGPVLVELGARLMGGMVADSIYKKSIAYSQASQLVQAYTANDDFLKTIDSDYQLNNHLLLYMLRSHQQGQLQSINFLDEIKKLPSVVDVVMHVQPGQQLKITKDYSSSPLHITFSHPSMAVIEKDIAQIKQYQAQGIFVVN